MIPQAVDQLHPTSQVTLGILAGGQGTRWGGRDKSMLSVNGETLLGKLVATWGPSCHEVIVNHHAGSAFHAHFADRLVCDAKPHQGPCLGIAALLAACETPLLLITPTDLVDPPAELTTQLQRAIPTTAAGLYVEDPDGQHSLVMLLRKTAAPQILRYVDRGGRRVNDMLVHAGICRFPFTQQLRDADSAADLS
ncbi:MAG: NTP transferase domain-containing protein [Halieaceae bacterium]|jgi:molybdopterin-guanine dinucleotide biosynthesis protein A|nr:NTP transferase domain-containing protein [Halieaceae bacterium]